MKQQELSVLSNVVGVVRRELADRDDEDIPPRLRKVARNSGRRLPPPFANSVVREVQENEQFRASVQDRWDSEGIDDPVGAAFLADPDAALETVGERAEERSVAELTMELERSRRTVLTLEEQLEESKRRLDRARDSHSAAIAEAQTAGSGSRRFLEGSVRSLEARIADLIADRDTLDGVADSLRAEITELKEKLSRSVEKGRKKALKQEATPRQPMTPPSDAVEFAMWLDSVERRQRPYREAKPLDVATPGDLPPLAKPDGLLPDTAEALIALIDQRPDVIYIDGYNVAALLVDEFSGASARSTVVAKADRLALASKARVVVVFDAMGVEGRRSAPTNGPTEVVFTHTQIADDEIVDLIVADPSRAVVVTSDRRLGDRCAIQGCVTVWSEAFVQWAAS